MATVLDHQNNASLRWIAEELKETNKYLNRIANCLEAAEKRARKVEEDELQDMLEELSDEAGKQER